MRLDIKLSLQTLRELLSEFAPVRIHLTPKDVDLRWVELERPESVEMVPGHGVRIVTHGRMRYTVAGIAIPLKIRTVTLLLEPKVLRNAGDPLSLAFELRIENFDFEHVPDLIDHALSERVNEVLRAERTPLTWVFGKTLTRGVPLPERLEPLSSLDLTTRDGAVTVEADGLTFSVDISGHLARSKIRPDDAERGHERIRAARPAPAVN